MLDFLELLDSNLQKNADAMLSLLDLVAETGPPRNTNICHQLRGDIWEFIKGSIRVLYFCDSGKIVVCTHALVKKRNTIGNSNIEKAEAVLTAFRAAVSSGTLDVEEEEENGQ